MKLALKCIEAQTHKSQRGVCAII